MSITSTISKAKYYSVNASTIPQDHNTQTQHTPAAAAIQQHTALDGGLVSPFDREKSKAVTQPGPHNQKDSNPDWSLLLPFIVIDTWRLGQRRRLQTAHCWGSPSTDAPPSLEGPAKAKTEDLSKAGG